MKARSGFTLIEILIVVVILGILAAIVIPQFSNASADAKLSNLKTQLQMVRSQIQLYKIEHNEALPSDSADGFVLALTSKTDIDGNVDAAGAYGPYLQSFPINPFNDLATVTEGTGAAGNDAAGWYFNTSTEMFYADTAAHAAL